LIDRLGLLLLRASRGRWARIANRRLNYAHVQIFTVRSIMRELEADDFVIERVNQVCDYGMTTETYLTSIGVWGQAGPLAARGMDRLMRRGLFVRNAIHVYARRGTQQPPQHNGHTPS
jgi:hypothetical protein